LGCSFLSVGGSASPFNDIIKPFARPFARKFIGIAKSDSSDKLSAAIYTHERKQLPV
jgi:hypothetical protein